MFFLLVVLFYFIENCTSEISLVEFIQRVSKTLQRVTAFGLKSTLLKSDF
jgi:hypothetical protein